MQEVEKYKQKKSVIEIGKAIRKMQKVKKGLGLKMIDHTKKALKMREMLGQVDQGVAQLLQQMPKNPTIELDQGEQ